MTRVVPHDLDTRGLHVAIIMDGNGRWATARGLARAEGHRAGTEAVRRTIETARELGIGTLTLYAFSADNWNRPAGEVAALMRNFEDFLASEALRWAETGVRASVIGRRNRLPGSLLQAIDNAETVTAGCRKMALAIAIDYSGRGAILQAANCLGPRAPVTPEEFSQALAREANAASAPPDIDLLIRTGGELRLSDLPLWEAAYAELYFTGTLWPDFDAKELAAALAEFHSRDRRFGRIVQAKAG